MDKGRLRQYFAAFSCQLSAMMVGSAFVWFTPLLESLKIEGSRIPMTEAESSWMISLIEIGELFSPLPAGILVNKIGRKAVLLSAFPLVAISWFFIVGMQSIEALYVARFLQGMAMGISFTAAPVYLAEIADAKIRGVLCGNFQTMWSLGILYAYVTGPFMSFEANAYANAAIAILYAVTLLWAPESPYYLIMSNQTKKAGEVLMYFRNTKDVEEEMQNIKASLKPYKEGNNSWKSLIATKNDRITLLVISSVAFVKYMSGVAAITTYLTETFSRSGGDGIDKNHVTIIIGAVMVLATLVSAYVSDLIGRKPLILISTAGSIIFNVVAGIYFLLVKLELPNVTDYSWIAYTSIGLYCIINNLGLSPLLQTLQAECFSSETRGLAGGFISFLGTILIFISLKQYQPVEERIGVYMNYFLFSLYSIIGSIAILAFMRETAGKTLTQIQDVNESEKTYNEQDSYLVPS